MKTEEKNRNLHDQNLQETSKSIFRKQGIKSSCACKLHQLSPGTNVFVIARILQIDIKVGVYTFKCVDDTGTFIAKYLSMSMFSEPAWLSSLNEGGQEYWQLFMMVKKHMDQQERVLHVEKIQKVTDYNRLVYERLQLMKNEVKI